MRATKFVKLSFDKPHSFSDDSIGHPKVLIKIADKGVKKFLDEEKYNYWIEKEIKEKR